MKRFDGQVALVTGAARGIGAATVRRLEREGASVLVTDMLDEEGEDPVLSKRRDKSLNAVGIKVMRIAAADVLADMDAVLARITAGMRMRIADKKTRAREHAEANPRQEYSRPTRKDRT